MGKYPPFLISCKIHSKGKTKFISFYGIIIMNNMMEGHLKGLKFQKEMIRIFHGD